MRITWKEEGSFLWWSQKESRFSMPSLYVSQMTVDWFKAPLTFFLLSIFIMSVMSALCIKIRLT